MKNYIREIVHMEVTNKKQLKNLIAYYKIEQRKEKCRITINISNIEEHNDIVYKLCMVYNDATDIRAKAIYTLELSNNSINTEIYTSSGNMFNTKETINNLRGFIVVAKKTHNEIEYDKDTILLGYNKEKNYSIIDIKPIKPKLSSENINNLVNEETKDSKKNTVDKINNIVEDEITNTKIVDTKADEKDVELNAAEISKNIDNEKEKKYENKKRENKTSENELKMYEDIFNNYPRMSPFENINNTEWVRIEVSDIIFLPLDKWMLINNTFLINCYRKYKHLILGRNTEDNKIILGIPDIYYPKNRVMATVHGFNSFKSCKDSRALAGEYGYWLIECEY